MAAAWDPALSYEIGTMIGHEVRAMGYNMSLGSGINMIREPRNGRTFEYKGEDPLLAGTLAGQELKAEKALHLITDVKHYAVNDQDAGRTTVNVDHQQARHAGERSAGLPNCPERLRRGRGDVLLQPHQRRPTAAKTPTL